MRPLEGYQLEREGSHAVALELELDDELVREGLAREIVHAVQNARKTAGLEVADRIELTLGGDDELLDAARAYEPYLAGETLAVAVSLRRRVGRRAGDRQGPPAAASRSTAARLASAGSSSASRRLRGLEPWMRVASAPLRKRIIVGIARIPRLGRRSACSRRC